METPFTIEQLRRMTKPNLVKLARDRFDVALPVRRLKDDLIDEIMELQERDESTQPLSEEEEQVEEEEQLQSEEEEEEERVQSEEEEEQVRYSREYLTGLTIPRLRELARETFNLTFPSRRTKAQLIDDFLEAQVAAQSPPSGRSPSTSLQTTPTPPRRLSISDSPSARSLTSPRSLTPDRPTLSPSDFPELFSLTPSPVPSVRAPSLPSLSPISPVRTPPSVRASVSPIRSPVRRTPSSEKVERLLSLGRPSSLLHSIRQAQPSFLDPEARYQRQGIAFIDFPREDVRVHRSRTPPPPTILEQTTIEPSRADLPDIRTVERMKVPELRALAGRLGITTSGRKAQLIDRIKDRIQMP